MAGFGLSVRRCQIFKRRNVKQCHFGETFRDRIAVKIQGYFDSVPLDEHHIVVNNVVRFSVRCVDAERFEWRFLHPFSKFERRYHLRSLPIPSQVSIFDGADPGELGGCSSPLLNTNNMKQSAFDRASDNGILVGINPNFDGVALNHRHIVIGDVERFSVEIWMRKGLNGLLSTGL